MKIAFAGTPDFAATALNAILASGFHVPLVLTQPDRPSGRGMQLQPSPVKALALAHHIPVDQPERLRSPEQQARLAECAPDVLVVAAYGLILPQTVLDLPRLGCLNIHASLLPRWRGAAPIHRAIEAGDTETGITIMQMDAGLDTGAMLMKGTIPILPQDSTGSLHDRLAKLGGDMIVQTLQQLQHGPLSATPQTNEGTCYARKIDKTESALDFHLDAHILARKLRAFTPFPGCTATIQGSTLKLWEGEAIDTLSGAPGEILAANSDGIIVACGYGALRLSVLQKPGGKRLPAREFLQGFALATGQQFSLPGEASPH
jgi:methionyl-tRNA formyltransferase